MVTNLFIVLLLAVYAQGDTLCFRAPYASTYAIYTDNTQLVYVKPLQRNQLYCFYAVNGEPYTIRYRRTNNGRSEIMRQGPYVNYRAYLPLVGKRR